MFSLSHKSLIALSGAVWFAVGLYLMPLGIGFILESIKGVSLNTPVINLLEKLSLTGEMAALFLLVASLALGYFKSKMIFSKAVDRGVTHIKSLPNPSPFWAVYTPKYLLLLAGMVLLGLSLKWFSVPLDIRGFVDVTIGAALLNGAVLYFRKIK